MLGRLGFSAQPGGRGGRQALQLQRGDRPGVHPPAPPAGATLHRRARCGKTRLHPAPGTAAGGGRGRGGGAAGGSAAGVSNGKLDTCRRRMAALQRSARLPPPRPQLPLLSAAACSGMPRLHQACWACCWALTASEMSSSRRTTATVGGERTTSPTRPSHLRRGACELGLICIGWGADQGCRRAGRGPCTHFVTASRARACQSRGWTSPSPAKPFCAAAQLAARRHKGLADTIGQGLAQLERCSACKRHLRVLQTVHARGSQLVCACTPWAGRICVRKPGHHSWRPATTSPSSRRAKASTGGNWRGQHC